MKGSHDGSDAHVRDPLHAHAPPHRARRDEYAEKTHLEFAGENPPEYAKTGHTPGSLTRQVGALKPEDERGLYPYRVTVTGRLAHADAMMQRSHIAVPLIDLDAPGDTTTVFCKAPVAEFEELALKGDEPVRAVVTGRPKLWSGVEKLTTKTDHVGAIEGKSVVLDFCSINVTQ